jgi:hypothetical protein
MEHFAYLEPDVICLAPDPVEKDRITRTSPAARGSVLFERYGYSPMLPPLTWVDRALATTYAPRAEQRYSVTLNASIETALRIAKRGIVVVLMSERDPSEWLNTISADLTRQPRVRVVSVRAPNDTDAPRIVTAAVMSLCR